jgi:hypothetical protein
MNINHTKEPNLLVFTILFLFTYIYFTFEKMKHP